MEATAVLQQGEGAEPEPIATDDLDDTAIAAIGRMSAEPSAVMLAVAVAKTPACSVPAAALHDACDVMPVTS